MLTKQEKRASCNVRFAFKMGALRRVFRRPDRTGRFIGGAAAAARVLDAESLQVYEILLVPFASVNVEGDLNLVSDAELVDQSNLILKAFEFNILWVFVVSGRDYELALCKAAAESLFIKYLFNGS